MRSAEGAPFGLEPVQPAFDRATRLAKLLFAGALDSTIVLIDGDRAWRSRGAVKGASAYSTARTSAAHRVMSSGQSLWIEDASTDPQYADEPSVTQLGLRFYAAAPVRLDDGTTPGLISVFAL